MPLSPLVSYVNDCASGIWGGGQLINSNNHRRLDPKICAHTLLL